MKSVCSEMELWNISGVNDFIHNRWWKWKRQFDSGVSALRHIREWLLVCQLRTRHAFCERGAPQLRVPEGDSVQRDECECVNRVMTRRWRDGEPSEEDGDRTNSTGVERAGFGRVHRVCEELFVQRSEFDGVERVSVDESSGVEHWRLLF